MEIHVYDTYVKAADGHTMHFDVITDVKKITTKPSTYGKEWLKSIGEENAVMTHKRVSVLPFTRCPRTC